MSEQKAYIIANLVIHEKDKYRNYEKGFFPLLKKYGGEFVTYDNESEHFEGTSPIDGRLIIFTFPSPEAARDWYNDTEYQELAEHRRSSSILKNLTMVKSLPLRK
tara:strand:+ start:250 stop:564 length:315 start_codon:yes stop_codon:yes gene_type:complete